MRRALTVAQDSSCPNHIQETCDEINKCIGLTVQNTLNLLHEDAEKAIKELDAAIAKDEFAVRCAGGC